MKQKFDGFPELLLVDATYMLKISVLLQLAIGEREIAAVFVVVSEDGETISLLVTNTNCNSAWEKTKALLTNKDSMEKSEQF